MAHVHHHHARNPVIAEWQAHNLAAQQGEPLVATVYVTKVVTAGASETPSPTAAPSTSTNTIQLSPGPSAPSSSQGSYSAPPRPVRPSQSTSSGGAASHTTGLPSTVPAGLLVASSSALLPGSSDAAGASNPVTTQSTGMSGGAKAGLAFGIIIIIALIAAAAVFFVRRKKQAEAESHQRLDDEKSEMRQRLQNNSSVPPVSAPRLSLRPLTQLFMLGSEKHDASARARTPDATAQDAALSNPFGDHGAEKAAIASPAAAAVSVPSSSASDRTLSNLSDRSNPSEGQAFPTVVAGSRRNSPPGPGPNNVHRVQLDFKPSMEDELELRAGSLVRMLHEYDDGWALCIRLDRSQQGVVPRTCISKLPVKPRPGPPPQNMRNSPPQGRSRQGANSPGPRMAPNGPPRGSPPAGRLRSQSNSPSQDQRSQSPAFVQHAQQGRPRSTSDAASAASGQIVASRKPAPGQAM